jgi:hypothetical protein
LGSLGLEPFARNEEHNDKGAKDGRLPKSCFEDRGLAAPVNNKTSYKEAVAGINTNTKGLVANQKTHPMQKRRLTDEEYRAGIQEIPPYPELLQKLQESFVGTLWEAVESEILQVTMWMEGYQQI